ncbi:MAG: lipase secretion chaperone [Collimonas sp.]|uniref:lipase secretion chaperone n=1 Tax=Collimonas sp. TaxID=1963772 RepID=UPI00326659A5
MPVSDPAGSAGNQRILLLTAVIIAAVICAAMIYWLNPSSAPVASAVADRAGATTTAAAVVASPASAAASLQTQAWPPMLQGTVAPGLPVDAQGQLEHKRDVRDFFDYFLTAQSVLTPARMDALVGQQIKAQLDGKPAESQAAALWKSYGAYLQALTQLAGTAGNGVSAIAADGATDSLTAANAVRLQSFIEQRAALRQRFLAEWSGSFFGEEDQAMLAFVARARIAQDKTLSDAERKRRLQEIEQNLPPGEHAIEQQQKQQEQWFAAVDQMRQQNLPPEAMWSEIAKLKGADFADRFVVQEQQNHAWQANYDQYAVQRSQIEAQDLSPQDQQAQIEQVRTKFFPKTSDGLRAAGLDQIAQLKH